MTDDKQKQQEPKQEVKLEDLPVDESTTEQVKGGPNTGGAIWLKTL